MIKLTDNFFRPPTRWAGVGERRLKNVRLTTVAPTRFVQLIENRAGGVRSSSFWSGCLNRAVAAVVSDSSLPSRSQKGRRCAG